MKLALTKALPTLIHKPTLTKKPSPTSIPIIETRIASTIKAYQDNPPVGQWCEGGIKGGIRMCVGEIHYLDNIGDIQAPGNSRFIVAIITLYNSSQSETTINPDEITLVMSDGRTYMYDPDRYAYWGFELRATIVAPGNNIQGGQVFLVPNTVGPSSFLYYNELLSTQIVVDLERPPDYP